MHSHIQRFCHKHLTDTLADGDIQDEPDLQNMGTKNTFLITSMPLIKIIALDILKNQCIPHVCLVFCIHMTGHSTHHRKVYPCPLLIRDH